jgi:peptide/nickel transport system permease protein
MTFRVTPINEFRPPARLPWILSFTLRNPGVVAGGAVLLVMMALAAGAGILALSAPTAIHPEFRLRPPSPELWFGGDAMGRDLWSRTVHGGRISLVVGVVTASVTAFCGLAIGLVAGFFRVLDGVVMRFMDGLMAIPGILLAIALMAVAGSSLENVIIAITIPEIPRVVRLVRAMTLSIREMPFVEAAVSVGDSKLRIILRHILPNTLAPLAVQATYVCGAAIIYESYLSFLGAGIPPEISSWGSIMAEGRVFFLVAPWMILIPGCFIGVTVLAINILGDGLRDMLDPRVSRNL